MELASQECVNTLELVMIEVSFSRCTHAMIAERLLHDSLLVAFVKLYAQICRKIMFHPSKDPGIARDP